MATLSFPPSFVWGAATAAYQIEGGHREDGRTDSIWDAFAKVPGAVSGGADGAIACDHYHRMPTDVALLKDLGITNYRFSTSWSRVRPDGLPNPRGLDFYSRLVDELLEAGITPWLTLEHWDLPQSIEQRGGWRVRETAQLFADFTTDVVAKLGDRVSHFITLNEPWCQAFLGYGSGYHAPGRASAAEAVDAAHVLLLAHGLGLERIRELAPSAKAGIVVNLTVANPLDPQNPADQEAARLVEGAQNRVFLDPIFKGSYPSDILESMAGAGLGRIAQPEDFRIISAPMDFIGVNFYNGCQVAGAGAHTQPSEGTAANVPTPAGNDAASEVTAKPSPYVGTEGVRWVPRALPHTAMDWEVWAPDLTTALVSLHEEYSGPAGIPIYVTENGAAYDDVVDDHGFVDDSGTRQRYIAEHITAVHDAIEGGANVDGYFVWSFMDNFEWSQGYRARFGVVRVDYDTLERIPKASAGFFSEVIAQNSISESRPDLQSVLN